MEKVRSGFLAMFRHIPLSPKNLPVNRDTDVERAYWTFAVRPLFHAHCGTETLIGVQLPPLTCRDLQQKTTSPIPLWPTECMGAK